MTPPYTVGDPCPNPSVIDRRVHRLGSCSGRKTREILHTPPSLLLLFLPLSPLLQHLEAVNLVALPTFTCGLSFLTLFYFSNLYPQFARLSVVFSLSHYFFLYILISHIPNPPLST